ncbi:hypothetical protein MASSI9I_51289 [Massilia sp. 9I]|nr:hypothetical protein MASSI9I_51289 [Massilia sp. 9I]
MSEQRRSRLGSARITDAKPACRAALESFVHGEHLDLERQRELGRRMAIEPDKEELRALARDLSGDRYQWKNAVRLLSIHHTEVESHFVQAIDTGLRPVELQRQLSQVATHPCLGTGSPHELNDADLRRRQHSGPVAIHPGVERGDRWGESLVPWRERAGLREPGAGGKYHEKKQLHVLCR